MNKTLEKLHHLGACPEALAYVEGAGDRDTLTLLRGARAEWVVWLAVRVLPPTDRRTVRAASACARAVLHAARPEDVPVLTSTLDLVDRWCAGEAVAVEKLRAAAVDAATGSRRRGGGVGGCGEGGEVRSQCRSLDRPARGDRFGAAARRNHSGF